MGRAVRNAFIAVNASTSAEDPATVVDVRVLLVDDHDLFRSGLAELLRDRGYDVRDAANGHAALELSRSFAADVVVMDMNMPELNGIETTRRLLALRPGTPILMLTVAADDDGVLDAIRAGAAGYLLKSARLPEIIAGIEAAAEGRSAIAPGVVGALVASVRQGRTRAPATAAGAALTQRERSVLALLAKGLDNTEIAARLFVSPSTVKNHVSSLLEKLGADNRVQAAAYAIRHGLDEDA